MASRGGSKNCYYDGNACCKRVISQSNNNERAAGNSQRTVKCHITDKAILDALKITPDNIDEIRTIPFQKIVEVFNTKDPVLPFGGVYFGPVLDERSLTRHPFYPDAPAQSSHIPMIIGNTHDETRAFLGGDPTNFTMTWEQIPEKLIPNMRVDIQPEMVISEYRKLYPQLIAKRYIF